MARYDDAYRYAGRAPGDRGHGPEWLRRAGGNPYDGDFRPHAGYGGGSEFAGDSGVGAPWGEDEGAVYGPARYGLGPYYRRLQQRRRPDDELKQDVEEALFYDTWIDAESISVDVQDGVVTLHGALPDHDEVRYATDDAWDVDGVRGVRSELRVDTSRRKPLDWVGGKRESQGRAGHGAGNG